MFRIETYPDPHPFFQGLSFEKDSLHITGIQSLQYLLREQAGEDGARVMHLDELMKLLYPRWYGLVTDYLFISKMRYYLHEEKISDEQKQGIFRFLSEWVKAFRFAVALRLQELPIEGKEEERCFARLYKRMLEDEEVKTLVHERWESAGQLLQKKRKEVKILYVYHLQQLDAKRMLFFRECERAGIQVVFRFPYHSDYEFFFQGWKDLYECVVSKSDPNDWAWGEPLQQGTRWIQHMMGRTAGEVQDLLQIEVLRFPSPAHFRAYAAKEGERQSGVQVVAPSYGELNQALRDLPPTESFDKRKKTIPFLPHHPAARFLIYLYQGKRAKGEVWLTFETLVECISSGWVQTKEVTGTEALPFLLELEPYLKAHGDRLSIKEIKERLHKLASLQAASKEFDQLAKAQAGRNRIKQYLTNPLRVFSFAQEERSSITVRQLADLLTDLESKLERLLPEEGQEMSTRDHFVALRQIWEGVKKKLSAEESVIKGLESVLNHSLPVHWLANQEDLQGLVAMLLHRKGEEERHFHCAGLEQLDGLALMENPLHLTDLSIRSLMNAHRKHQSLPRPLTLTWLKHGIRQQKENGRLTKAGASYILHALLVHYYSDQAWNRFVPFQLFYTFAYSRGPLTVSWIEGWHEHDAASSDWELLAMLYGELGEGREWEEAKADWSPIVIQEGKKEEQKKRKGPVPLRLAEQIPGVYWTDLDLCPRKFFLTSFLEHSPVYTNDFQHQLAFGLLGALFSQQIDGEEGVHEYFSPLFPQWTSTMKKSLVRTSRRGGLREYTSFQNLVYPKAMGQLQRLRSSSRRTRFWKAYMDGQMKEKEWLKEWVPLLSNERVMTRPGSHCRMCPYLMYCTEGAYPIDDSSRSI